MALRILNTPRDGVIDDRKTIVTIFMKQPNMKLLLGHLETLGITPSKGVLWNLEPAELVTDTIQSGEGVLTDTGALMCDTGKFTGRSPKDRFIVKDDTTQEKVWWGDINISFDEDKFDGLLKRMAARLSQQEKIYVRDAFVGADETHRLRIRVIDTQAWHNLFCYNMFIRPEQEERIDFTPDFTILAVPDFKADPMIDGTRQENFAIINFKKRIILVGGTGYTGETKKGIFSVLNFLLPEKHVLPMHCSANQGRQGDTAIFFGLSGTGKTTLSADPQRSLIGDDEHGWTDHGIFNFEGGCYAKVIDLSKEKEPEIWDAIRFGAILENTRFVPGTRTVDYANGSVTENTRVSYPLKYINNALIPSVAAIPKNIFFLTCDAYGVLPPLSRLTAGQAMYHFVSGYTAKVAGTETGITEPSAVFSACFGAPFMPLHPTRYAELLGEKIEKYDVNIWLINTGWSGGGYGVGSRIKLAYTRAMITAVLEGTLKEDVETEEHAVFGLQMIKAVPGVPQDIMNPRNTWAEEQAYDQQADNLARMFIQNFKKFEAHATDDMLRGAPRLLQDAMN